MCLYVYLSEMSLALHDLLGNMIVNFCYIIFLLQFVEQIVNGSQLAKMKKYIPYVSLP